MQPTDSASLAHAAFNRVQNINAWQRLIAYHCLVAGGNVASVTPSLFPGVAADFRRRCQKIWINEGHMKLLLSILGFVLVILIGSSCSLSSVQISAAFYKDLEALFTQYYPGHTSTVVGSKIHFEYNAGILIDYYDNEKKYQIQYRGPKKGGIMADMGLGRGKYVGQAESGYTFDYLGLHKELMLAPYSRKGNCYLYVHLKYPEGTNPEFIREFTRRINSFERFL